MTRSLEDTVNVYFELRFLYAMELATGKAFTDGFWRRASRDGVSARQLARERVGIEDK